MDERVKIIVNSCIRKMNRIGMRRSRKPCAARPRDAGEKHAVSKFRRAISMKIASRLESPNSCWVGCLLYDVEKCKMVSSA